MRVHVRDHGRGRQVRLLLLVLRENLVRVALDVLLGRGSSPNGATSSLGVLLHLAPFLLLQLHHFLDELKFLLHLLRLTLQHVRDFLRPASITIDKIRVCLIDYKQ